MATRKKANKETHGERTHSALKSLNTTSSELNASLLNPKTTPPPRSSFSALFKTKGNRANINKDILISPSKGDVKYEVTPRNLKKVPSVEDYGGKNVVGKGGKKGYTSWKNKADEAAYNAAVQEVTTFNIQENARFISEQKEATDQLNADLRSFSAAQGSRTSRGKTKGITGKGARGRNGVL